MSIVFDSPWYLLLLLLLPAIWYVSRDSLTSMGKYRRWFAIIFRSVVYTLIVCALAEMQFARTNDRVTVIYLLDQSESIPKTQRETMIRWVKRNVSKFRSDSRRDKAAVIVFGRDAAIEVAPLDDDLPIADRIETSVYDLRPEATNLAQALKLAQATFPEDSSRRIVVVSDGNENEGDAKSLMKILEDEGISVDVAPVVLEQRAEVEVDKISLPSDTRIGQPFDAKVVINNLAQATTEDDGAVEGMVRVWRRRGKSEEMLTEQEVTLPPGKHVLQFRNQIDEKDFWEYEAEFTPLDPGKDDAISQNNRAKAFTQVLGEANVLLIEDWEKPGQFDTLIQRLRDQDIEITVQSSDNLFTSLADLQRYDCVVLADVPRSSGNVDVQTNFSDEQVSILVRNTQKLGCGLIMLGGPSSFGAGGWTNTELEKAMPVDFQIYNAKVIPVGALGLVMHASEMANGNFWQKEISREALKVLGPHDYCGVVHWNDRVGKEDWLWGKPDGLMRVGNNNNKDRMMAKISAMTPGDMPEFDPSLAMAAGAFARLQRKNPAAVKHMIAISDGDPTKPTNKTLQAFKNMKIKISTVAVGTHGAAGSKTLSDISKFTGGKYYKVANPKMLPRIFQKESMRVARPLVKEKPGLVPIIAADHEILKGIDTMPAFDGFVLTSKKENSLVDVVLKSPDPPDNISGKDNNTLLATWTYGAGRTVVFTTDAGHRWANDWTQWDGYDQFFGQMMRWAMRPTGDRGKFALATQIKGGVGKVIVTAMDDDENLVSFLDIGGDVINPDLTSSDIQMKQVAPGRYEATFDATKPGSYFLAMSAGPDSAPLRTGFSVPYSAEYQDRETNEQLLASLATIEVGGEQGKIHPVNFDATQETPNPFRESKIKPRSTQDIWPLLLLLSSCLFLGDVFIRRVAVNFDWAPAAFAAVKNRITGGEVETTSDDRMARLRSRKAAIAEEVSERKAATRFEPTADEDVDVSILDESSEEQAKARETKKQQSFETTKEEESFTERLLKAKEQARKKK